MTLLARIAPPLPGLTARRASRLVERNIMGYRRQWLILLSGFFEPVFYLFGIGYGLGALVPDVAGVDGQPISYGLFVAPALQVPMVVLAAHAAFSTALLWLALKHNARWFAAHLEEV